VSNEHANFVVNTGSASAGDVATLVRMVRRAIAERTGILLEVEIEAVGRWAADAFAVSL
jgi:UDP-N-acetylmuramate dehydrogenase